MHSVKKVWLQFHVALHFSIENFTIDQNVPYSFKRKTLQLCVITQWAIFLEKSGNGNVCNVSYCTAFEQLYHQKCNKTSCFILYCFQSIQVVFLSFHFCFLEMVSQIRKVVIEGVACQLPSSQEVWRKPLELPLLHSCLY